MSANKINYTSAISHGFSKQNTLFVTGKSSLEMFHFFNLLQSPSPWPARNVVKVLPGL